ncbi:MAG: alkaline phosphatase family protein, partial [Candidatus Hydrogenedentes bacterium]|nr:alkaline phosphatase family protein [Candidatus Hydrogenedentota bacterium]
MKKKDVEKVSRRAFIGTGATALGTLTACGSNAAQPDSDAPPAAPQPKESPAPAAPPPPKANPKGRVIILGFDGVEPSIVEQMLEAGELPNLAKLRDAGAYARLGSTIPPQSPVAWTSFATCKNPGGHGIYDFIRRTPARYRPGIGTGQTSHPDFAPDGSVRKPASSTAYRKGRSFWAVADDAGIRSKILNVPFVYPPDELKHGIMLSGLGVPDIRCTDSTFFSLSDAYAEEEKVSGGVRLPLKFDGDTARVNVPGARDPRKKSSEPGAYIDAPVTVKADRSARTLAIEASGKTLSLAEGEWSDWV